MKPAKGAFAPEASVNKPKEKAKSGKRKKGDQKGKPEKASSSAKPKSPSRSPKKVKTHHPGRPPDGKIRFKSRSRTPLRRRRHEEYSQDEESSGTKGKSSASDSTSGGDKIPQMPLYTEYKYGSTNVDPQQWDGRPKALIIFSGRPRDGDLACYLYKLGWIVVVIDLLGPNSTDLLDVKIRSKVLRDIKDKVFDVVGIATPCETLSPLRENPPGPRPLRSLEHPDGLPAAKLTKDENKQLKEANALMSFTEEVVDAVRRAKKAFWIENPDHREKLDIWKTSWFKRLVGSALTDKAKFDQCTFGAETVKPTILLSEYLEFGHIANRRCEHEKKEWKRPDGATYRAAHESLVQRWREGTSGKRERASKALGEYPPALNKAIADAMDKAYKIRAWDPSLLENKQK